MLNALTFAMRFLFKYSLVTFQNFYHKQTKFVSFVIINFNLDLLIHVFKA